MTQRVTRPACLLLLALLGDQTGAAISQETRPAAVAGQEMTMEKLFETALQAQGPEYLRSEAALLGGGEAARKALQLHLNDLDPLVRLLAGLLIDWQQARPGAHQAALDYLDRIGPALARTAAGSPSPVGVANDLTLRFGASVVDLLAVRLIKSPEWPRWRMFGVLLYLNEHKLALATAPLLRFAAESADEEARELALETVRATPDPDLAAKVAAEERHQALRGRNVPLSSVLPKR
jgi:hypothetical protein